MSEYTRKTRAQADSERLAQREEAFREGYRARQSGARINPYSSEGLQEQAKGVLVYPGSQQQRPKNAGEAAAWVAERRSQWQHRCESWNDGYDTAERTAALKGDDFMLSVDVGHYPKVRDLILAEQPEMFPDQVRAKGWRKGGDALRNG
jgi:hypothetical protein